eukprot:symbB.v1.2.018458.t1/scaffold1471.1/size116838/6
MSLIWNVKESKKAQIQRRRQEREVEAKEAELFVSSVTNGIEPPPFELPSEPEQRLKVPAQCMGLVIGKKGEHLKSLEQKYKVSLKIETEETASHSTVTVSGNSVKSVSAAVAELDFDYQTIEVKPAAMARWLRAKALTLKQIREMTGVTLLSLKGDEDIESGAATPIVEIKGLKSQVQSAVLCLQAHMSYYSVFSEMEQVEKDLDARIAEAKLRTAKRPASTGGQSAGKGRERSLSRPKGRSQSPKSKAKGGAATGRKNSSQSPRRQSTRVGGRSQSPKGKGKAARGRSNAKSPGKPGNGGWLQ